MLLFIAKKQKEETPEVQSGVFVFSNGDRYGVYALVLQNIGSYCSFAVMFFALMLLFMYGFSISRSNFS